MSASRHPMPSRRTFVKQVAAGSLAALAAPAIVTAAKTDCRDSPIIGDGDHQYEVNHDWAQLPDKFTWQTTHNVAVDGDGPRLRHPRRPPRPAGPSRRSSSSTPTASSSARSASSSRAAATASRCTARAATSSSTSPRTSRSARSPSSRSTAKRSGTSTPRWSPASTPRAKTVAARDGRQPLGPRPLHAHQLRLPPRRRLLPRRRLRRLPHPPLRRRRQLAEHVRQALRRHRRRRHVRHAARHLDRRPPEPEASAPESRWSSSPTAPTPACSGSRSTASTAARRTASSCPPTSTCRGDAAARPRPGRPRHAARRRQQGDRPPRRRQRADAPPTSRTGRSAATNRSGSPANSSTRTTPASTPTATSTSPNGSQRGRVTKLTKVWRDVRIVSREHATTLHDVSEGHAIAWRLKLTLFDAHMHICSIAPSKPRCHSPRRLALACLFASPLRAEQQVTLKTGATLVGDVDVRRRRGRRRRSATRRNRVPLADVASVTPVDFGAKDGKPAACCWRRSNRSVLGGTPKEAVGAAGRGVAPGARRSADRLLVRQHAGRRGLRQGRQPYVRSAPRRPSKRRFPSASTTLAERIELRTTVEMLPAADWSAHRRLQRRRRSSAGRTPPSRPMAVVFRVIDQFNDPIEPDGHPDQRQRRGRATRGVRRRLLPVHLRAPPRQRRRSRAG